MTGATVCSGILAPEVAMPWVDWQWCAEIDPFACALIKHHRPKLPNLGDVTAPDFIERCRSVDLLVAGTPCQAFSVAGLRKSLDDSRGNITLRLVEIVHAIRTGILLWENVAGVLSTRDNAFGCFLGGLVGSDAAIAPAAKWRRAGVAVGPFGTAAWRVFDAQYFGLAQRRARLFVVFCSGNSRDPVEILFEREGGGGNPPSRSGARQTIAPTISARAKGGGGFATDFELDGGLIAPPLTSNPYGDNASRECLLAFGGNNTSGDIDIATACRAHHSVHLDFESETMIVELLEANGKAAGSATQQDAEMGMLVTHSLRGDGFDASEDGTGRGTPLIAVAFTERGRKEGRNLETQEDLAYALTNPGSGGRTHSRQLLTPQMSVRRLTPTECERLMGFPEGYTAIPYRGKPAADGPRYKALGNSMAVPVIAWIGNRIQAVTAAK